MIYMYLWGCLIWIEFSPDNIPPAICSMFFFSHAKSLTLYPQMTSISTTLNNSGLVLTHQQRPNRHPVLLSIDIATQFEDVQVAIYLYPFKST